jgi:predicted TIM-barrel enzyme
MKIIPVIHHKTKDLTIKNAKLCFENNTYGIFIISMEGKNTDLSALAKKIKNEFPTLKVGVNHLGYQASESIYEGLNYSLDMIWSDEPIVTGSCIHEEAIKIEQEIKNSSLMFFNSVSFKYQKEEFFIEEAVQNSKKLGFIPTTSGKATGVAADVEKINKMKRTLGDYPLAIASGLTPENILEYTKMIEYGLVSTGISKSFYEFDEIKLKELIEKCKI